MSVVERREKKKKKKKRTEDKVNCQYIVVVVLRQVQVSDETQQLCVSD